MITRMTKYTFLLLRSDTEAFLREMQELGVLDITRSRKPVDTVSAELFREAESIRREIIKAGRCDFSRDDQHNALSGKLLAAEAAHAEKLHWGDFDEDKIKALEDAGYHFRFYTVAANKFNPMWAAEYPLEIIEEDAGTVRFVIVDDGGGTADFPLPETRVAKAALTELFAETLSLSKEIEDREATLLARKQEIPRMQEAYSEKMQELQRYLANEGAEPAADDHISVLTGFAPTEDDARLKAVLDRQGIFYLSEAATAADNPPVRLRNNWFARNFETLTGLYGMPVYDEFDPTPVLAPFFLLFWAFCMGDAGYGILLVIVGLLLDRADILGLRKHKRLVITLGVGTFFIGLLLGTFFGVNLNELQWIPEGLRNLMLAGRIDAGSGSYDVAMVAAIAIGIFHICLAMVIKAVGRTRRFGIKEAVSSWGWVILLVGGLSVAGLAFTKALNAEATRVAVIAVGVISALGIFIFNKPGRNPLLNVGAGLWESYQMATGLLGDVLSYIRLYALGLAGGMLGAAFNNLGAMALGSNPTWQWLPFLLIVITGHVLNFTMSCLGAFVHPLRLTFVEYFKNSGYEGKGLAYEPLKKL